jgi:DNA-binding MarR family transcriptional regulator
MGTPGAASTVAKEEHSFRIGFLVHDVSRLRRTVLDKALKPAGVTRSQWWVLANLSRYHSSGGMMQTELAKVMDVGKVTLGGLIDRLEAAGYVSRRPDPSDRRAKRVVLTPEGSRLLGEIQVIGRGVNDRTLAGISKADIACTEEVLHKMKQKLINMDAVPGANPNSPRRVPAGPAALIVDS